MRIDLPEYARDAVSCLEAQGFEAFVVGGCVRDSLLGVTPGDWDVCTSATPEEMKACFAGYRVIETGLKHGTLTVRIGGENVEITTYRLDGEYRDHRRPESVEFVRRLNLDLMRRDFTVNAMAYSPRVGLVDLFGGQEDLKARVIRCVGSPEHRFQEDALRLLRALRFAARFDFAVEAKTAAALREKADLMAAIAAERIFAEIKKLACASAARRIFTEYAELFDKWIPGMAAERAAGIDYWNRLPEWPELRLSLLTDRPEDICRFLKTDGPFRKKMIGLCAVRERALPTEGAGAMRFLAENGWDIWEMRLALAQARGENTEICREALERALEEGRVWQVEKLAISGNDLMEMGLRGPHLGEARRWLLEAVMDGEMPNERDALMRCAERWI